jgi:hypothetical protein
MPPKKLPRSDVLLTTSKSRSMLDDASITDKTNNIDAARFQDILFTAKIQT